MKHGLTDLMTDFSFVGADRLDVRLVENDAVRSHAEVKHASLGGRHPLEHSQKQVAGLAGTSVSRSRERLFARPWSVLNEYREVVNTFSELHRKGVQHFLHQLNEVLMLHLALPLDPLSPRLALRGFMTGVPALSGVGVYS